MLGKAVSNTLARATPISYSGISIPLGPRWSLCNADQSPCVVLPTTARLGTGMELVAPMALLHPASSKGWGCAAGTFRTQSEDGVWM